MTLRTAQVPTADVPLTITFAAAALAGDTFRNTGKEHLRLRNTTIATAVQAPPAAPTAARSVSTSPLLAGVYQVALAWGNASGETPLSALTPVTLTLDGDIINITAIPAVPSGMTFAAIYCSIAAGSMVLARVAQVTIATHTISALPTGAPPYLPSFVALLVAQTNCSFGFLHDSAPTTVPLGSAVVEVGGFSPLRFNDGSGLAHVTYTPAGSGLELAVVG